MLKPLNSFTLSETVLFSYSFYQFSLKLKKKKFGTILSLTGGWKSKFSNLSGAIEISVI